MKKQITDKLKKIIQAKTKQKKIQESFNFVQSELLDSIDILDIISTIEKSFKIKFKNSDLLKIKKYKIKKLSELIYEKN